MNNGRGNLISLYKYLKGSYSEVGGQPHHKYWVIGQEEINGLKLSQKMSRLGVRKNFFNERRSQAAHGRITMPGSVKKRMDVALKNMV